MPANYETGRPTKYREEYCELLKQHMKEGYSFETFGALVGVSEATVHNWARENDKFLEAKKEGSNLSRKWWEDLHRRCAVTGKGNATLIIWAQRNKWPKHYRDRIAKGANDIQHNIKGNLDFKQLVSVLDREQMTELVNLLMEKAKDIETNDMKLIEAKAMIGK